MKYLVTAKEVVNDISSRKALKESIRHSAFGELDSSSVSKILRFIKEINKARERNSYNTYLQTSFTELSEEFNNKYQESIKFMELLGFSVISFVDDSDFRNGDIATIKIDWIEGRESKSKEAEDFVKLLVEVYQDALD